MSVQLSIVTICYNNLADLQASCQSVDEQTVLPFEHIIINGSTEQAINQWLSSQPQPGYRKWLSEADKGIADAFNKGVRLSTGNLLLMLNAGDLLSNKQVLGEVLPHFEKDSELMWLHGMYQYQRAGLWVVLGKPFNKALLYRGMRSICHQTMYYRKTLHNKYGVYDPGYRIAMDFDFVVRIRDEKMLFVQKVLAIFAPGGTSMQQMERILTENTRIVHKHLGNSLKHRLWTLRQRALIWLLQTRAGKGLYRLKVAAGLENS